MPKTRIGPAKPEVLKASYAHLQPHSIVDYPIRLTAQSSYLAGRASLVFGSPTLVIPADDVAQFGFTDQSGPGGSEAYYPPNPGAALTVWFLPSQADRDYHIDFFIDLNAPGTLSLENFALDTESIEVDSGTGRTIGTTFHAVYNTVWAWFTVWYDNYWKLDHCEINQLA